jgi:hypothetical protein
MLTLVGRLRKMTLANAYEFAAQRIAIRGVDLRKVVT